MGLEQGLSFGTDRAADVRLIAVRGDMAEVSLSGSRYTAKVPGGGQHRALTLCAVLATCHLLGADIQPALSLSDQGVPVGRGKTKVILHGLAIHQLFRVVVFEGQRVLGSRALVLNLVAVEIAHRSLGFGSGPSSTAEFHPETANCV